MVAALQEHCRIQQINLISDLNSDFQEGLGIIPISRFADKRASFAIYYLGADIRARANLQIITDAMVNSLTTNVADGRPRVAGVAAEINGKTHSFTAGEVIISAGAPQSPVMLLRAGVGPAQALKGVGVKVIADRPGIGGNLHNHHVLSLVFHLRRSARPPKGVRGNTTSMLRYSSNVEGCPIKDMYIPFIANTGWDALGQRLSSFTPTVAKPISRGRISLTSGDIGPRPLIEFNYHSDDRDRVRHMGAVCRAAEMLLSPEVRPLWHHAVPISRNDRVRQFNRISTANAIRARAVATLIELIPAASRPILNSLTNSGIDILKLVQDEDTLSEFVRDSVTGPAHHVGTCRMGSAEDPDAVVDQAGRVYGVEGLRVVDASIMPWVPRGNTNIPTLMLAEKSAAEIL